MPRIVYLDAYTLNPGDLSWSALEELGELEVFDRTLPPLIIQRMENTEILLTNKVKVSEDLLEKLPKLKYIGVTATGYDIIDVEATKKKNIVVTNVPAYGTEAVAQHTFALLLALTNKVSLHAESVKKGNWTNAQDWTYTLSPLSELYQKTLGIIGFGKIGQKVGEIGRAFGMKVMYHSRSDKGIDWAEKLELDNLIAQSDVISLHLPLTSESQEMVNESFLSKMKASAILLNSSRGKLIDETALTHALENEVIAGAALDVLSQEPPEEENPLLTAPNVIITPHNAWVAKETRQRILDIVIDNLKAYLSGNPQNVVNS